MKTITAEEILGLIKQLPPEEYQKVVTKIGPETTSQIRQHLAASFFANNILVSANNPSQIWKDIVEGLAVFANASGVRLILVDAVGEIVDLFATENDDLDMNYLIRPDGFTMKVMDTGHLQVIEDVTQNNRVNPFGSGIVASIGLPVSIEGKRIGVIWIYYDKPHPLSEAEIETLQIYVNQATIAYNNLRRINELEHMRLSAEALARTASLPEVLEQIVAGARQVLGADSAVIYSYDDIREEYIQDESVSSGIPYELWHKYQKINPRPGGTTQTTMTLGWVGVNDVTNTQEYSFLSKTTQDLLVQTGVRSFQGVALVVGDEKLGVLYLNYNRQRSFNAEEQRTARTFANHAALALKNAKLLDNLSKAQNTARIVANLTTLENLNDTLVSVVEGTQSALNCDVVTLYIYDQEKNSIVYPPTMIGVRYPERTRILPNVPKDSLVASMLQRDELYIGEDVSSDSMFRNTRFGIDEDIASCIAIPLKVGSERVGVMFVNYRHHHRFTSDEIGNIRLFANQAAVAIHNAQMYERQQKRTVSLEALSEAARAVTRTLNLDEILSSIVEQAWKLTGTSTREAAFSHLALVEGKKLTIKATYPAKRLPELRENFEVILGDSERLGILGSTVKLHQPVLVVDVREDPDYIELHKETRSELAVPIQIDGHVIGVINVEHSQVNAFDEHDIQVLATLAEYASIAINNAKLYQELKEVKGLVGARTALAWMGMASNAWRHSIEGDAVNIRNIATLLRHEIQGSVTDKITLQRIEDRLNLMERVANQILERPITPPLTSEEGVEYVNINDLIAERVHQLWENDPFKMIEGPYLNFEKEEIIVLVSPEWIRLALDLLVDNAAEAMVASSVRRINISTTVTDNVVEIAIQDTGKGLAEEVLPTLFGRVIEPSQQNRRLGRGLLMVQAIVQTYGGDVQVRETGPEGTTMVFMLPIAEEVTDLSTSFLPTKVEIPKNPELSRFYNELVHAYEELLELDRRKTEFLSTVSHELRTPLMPVQSCIEFMLSGMYGSLTNKQRERLEIALKNVHDEVRLIDNLLDLVRIQEGRITLELEETSFIQLARDVINIFEYDAQKRNISLMLEVENANWVEHLRLDGEKIKRVITNLVSNAFKFTSDGGAVVISVSKQDNHVKFLVRDTGVGIDEEEFEKIFSRFYQVDSSLTRQTGGTGIGLNICRKYVELHGGRIWVQASERGKGSTFAFTLPLLVGD